MKMKKLLIAFLAAANVALAALLLARTAGLPAAMAQPARAGAGYICATGTPAGRTFEVLHMIDLGDRKLHSVFPDRNQLIFSKVPRDLEKDFGN